MLFHTQLFFWLTLAPPLLVLTAQGLWVMKSELLQYSSSEWDKLQSVSDLWPSHSVCVCVCVVMCVSACRNVASGERRL